jgi:putative ABC transport system ATP-binding protein
MQVSADLMVSRLTVQYGKGPTSVQPFSDLSLQASDGQLVIVRGPSGGGKTSLLSVLAGLLRPLSGAVTFAGRPLHMRSRADVMHHRRHVVGVVFQSFNLIPSLTARENVMAPLTLTGVDRDAASERAVALLSSLGLEERLNHRPGELSGGQQQRVAIARGLVRDPPLLLIDEPTAHLDTAHVQSIVDVLRRMAQPGRLVVATTHDARVAAVGDQLLDLTPR